ncbi:MAG: hypothetical protein SAL07_09485 [Oscillatoria sp. PMC 1051.18]|nr:hypothetical protein [Oscillatoria sp. PMC 1051.18]
MNHYPSLLLLSVGMILGAVQDPPAIAPPAELTPAPRKFYVECHSFIPASEQIEQDYGYHLRAFGYGEPVENGVNINLDENNIFLSVDSKQPEQEKYLPLYEKIPLVKHSQESNLIEYIPQDFAATLVVGYDIDVGAIFIEHQFEGEIIRRGKGGCLFVPLPS